MSQITRRSLVVFGTASLGLAACGNGIGSGGAAQIDARVDEAHAFLLSRYPTTRDLINKAVGVLYMPLMTEAGFWFGGAFGRGALRINGISVDYYAAAEASVGPQIGIQQYSHALFFMTEKALADFRRSDGWALGADARYATPDGGGAIGTDTTTTLAPVIALVYGQSGLIVGATLAGTKYTRIIP